MSQPRVVALVARHKRLAIAVVLLAIAGIIAPQLADFQRSLSILEHARWWYVLAAVFLTAMIYILQAEQYHMLVKKPVGLPSLQLVQFATGLASRLAPIGVGSVTLNILFLRRRQHSLPQAVAVVTMGGCLSFLMHFAVLGLIVPTVSLPDNLHLAVSRQTIIYSVAAVVALVVLLATVRPVRHRALQAFSRTLAVLAGYRNQPRRLLAAAMLCATQSAVYVLILMACALALGAAIPFNQAYVIYTFSLLLGAIVATPGGLGGVEAGLTGGLVAYGMGTDTALAIALLYRLVTYWLPLLPGAMALRVVQKRYF